VWFKPIVFSWLEGIVGRVGKAEAARLIGIAKSQVSKYYHNPPQKVQKATARAILQVLKLLQEEDVKLHRDAIKHGYVERGKVAKRPRTMAEHNGQHSPGGNAEYKRRYRAVHLEAR
jgi:transposase-like protein